MNYWDKKLVREQLDGKLKPLKNFVATGLSNIGWIKTVREALGMTSSQLAMRAGLSQSRISHLEKAEEDGNIKLSTMHNIAKGLGMEFVYGFVPKDTLESMVREQARKIAMDRMKRLNHTMRLELQELSDNEKENALKDMIDKILIDEPKDFWNK